MAPTDDRTHIDAEAFGGVLEGQHFLVLRKRQHATEPSFVRFSRKQRISEAGTRVDEGLLG